MFRIIILIAILLPNIVMASNAGIVKGLWYDKEMVFEGETVRIYTAIRNNTGSDLSGTIEFYVNGNKIERNNVSALDGRIVESWADWQATSGTNTVKALLSRTELSSTASGTQAVEVISALAEDILFVDIDTDKDGVGDKEEVAKGTDPLVDEKQTKETQADKKDIADNTESSETPAGLEQYLDNNRADSTFTSLTETINNTKKKIDNYRESRKEEKTEVEADVKLENISASTSVDTIKQLPESITGGFGTITRSIATSSKNSFITGIKNVAGNIFTLVFSGILAVLSFVLGFPALLELSLLIFILYIILKSARRLARRPK